MANKNDYVSEERLYLNSKGKVVGENDPDKQTLLVAKDGRIPREKAIEHGLIQADPDEDGAVRAAGDPDQPTPSPEQIAVRTLTPEPGSPEAKAQAEKQAGQSKKSAASKSDDAGKSATGKTEK